MAVVKMERLHICGMKRDRKKMLEFLQRRGVVEVFDAGGGPEDDIFKKVDTASTRAQFERHTETAMAAIEILGREAELKEPSLAFLKGRRAVTVQQHGAFYERWEEVLRVAQRIVLLQRQIAEGGAEALRLEAYAETLTPWMRLPVSQTFAGTKKTAAFVGVLDGEHSLQDILAALAQAAPELDPLHAEIVYADKRQTCLLVVAMKRQAALAEEALRSIGFARPPQATSQLPADKYAQLMEQKQAAEKSVEAAHEEIRSYAESWDDLHYLADFFRMRVEKYEVIERLAVSKHTFVLDGYVQAEDADRLTQALTTAFVCDVQPLQADEPGDGDEPPVELKNNWFTEPVESVVRSYSLPAQGEVDPTGVMAIFYYAMFGLMFSDAAYGAIVAGVCGFCLLRFKNMEPNWSKNVRLFFWCGVSTLFWGIVFSSYFGDIVDVVSQTFFGHKVSIPPLWFYPMEQPMLLLIFSLAIGMVHLSLGYVMKGVTNAKQGDYPGIIYDCVFPLLSWWPLMVIFVGTGMFEGLAGFRLYWPPIVNYVCIALFGIACVGILLTGGRESKGVVRILKGIFAVYSSVSGWLGDMLSYSRLLALGLATGVIASVMNMLGTMLGASIPGIILFIVVFVAGQGLNFGINVLGAYVHSNRLEYVEFFGKFYDGGGRGFAPFGIHTKYYKINEEDSPT